MQWTPEGDAFVIGSDIKRLESETLPQFFRHNRFQSLVRQLNFYSFRKINRERNVWIYKHELFHRDRVEDLHLVRRRTCPGMDGRKQRFSSRHPRRVSETGDVDPTKDNGSDDSSTSSEEQNRKKRRAESTEDKKPASLSKRSRRLWNGNYPSSKESTPVIEKQIIEPLKDVDVTPVDKLDTKISSLSPAKIDRVEMAEQSTIVSEVAMQLEQYARKANKGRSRPLRSGVVTPQYDSSGNSLLTYDDEYGYDSDDNLIESRMLSTSLSLVADGDESLASSEDGRTSASSSVVTITPVKTKVVVTPPVTDKYSARSMTSRMLERSTDQDRPALVAPATVASFCMSTSPSDDKDLCSKILQLVAENEQLSAEFQSYLMVLRPSRRSETGRLTIQQMWESEAHRRDAVRYFMTFAVNCVHQLLHSTDLLTEADKSVLERTADAWIKSEGVRA